jgi:hypothetical protein
VSRVRNAAVTILVAALSGCASWKVDRPGYLPQLVVIQYEKDLAVVRKRCANDRSEGCSFRVASNDEPYCLVILGPNASDACGLRHELTHCAGWTHLQPPAFRMDCGE